MLTAEAHVKTERASRYLIQLSRHADHMRQLHRSRTYDGADTHAPPEVGHVEWSDTDGIVRLSVGQWTMHATSDTLTLRVEAATEENLQQIQALLAARLEKIGGRDHLTVDWQPPQASTVEQPGQPDTADDPRPDPVEEAVVARRGHRATMVLTSLGALGVVLALAVHVGLGGAALVASRWLGWTAVGLVIVPVLAVLGHAALPVIVLGARRLAIRGSNARRRRAHVRVTGHGDRHR